MAGDVFRFRGRTRDTADWLRSMNAGAQGSTRLDHFGGSKNEFGHQQGYPIIF